MPTAAVQNDRRKRRLPIWLLLTVCGVAFLLLTLLIAFYRGRAKRPKTGTLKKEKIR